MPLVSQGKNNWKFILIVAVLAIFAVAEILIHISDFNSDLTFLSFFTEGQKPEKNIGVSKEAIQKLFVEKYSEYANTLSVNIEKETEKYVRGSVNFVTGAPGGIFLAMKSEDKWQIVQEGNGQIPCSLSNYGFPIDMLSDCTAIETNNPMACPMDAKLCPSGSYVSRTGPNCEFAACPANNINCKDSSKYFVISRSENDSGTDFLVKYKTSNNQIMPCSYIVEKTDFELKDQAATYFLALTDDFLILDSGTAPDPRGLTVYNLNSRKKVYTDSYSKPISIQNDTMIYWSPIEEKVTNENCPEISQYLANGLSAGIEARVSLSLSNLIKKELGEYRCSPRQ
jgi:hypothetical protein